MPRLVKVDPRDFGRRAPAFWTIVEPGQHTGDDAFRTKREAKAALRARLDAAAQDTGRTIGRDFTLGGR